MLSRPPDLPNPPNITSSQPAPQPSQPSSNVIPPNIDSVCSGCNKICSSARGVAIHKRYCPNISSSASARSLQHHNNTISLRDDLAKLTTPNSVVAEAYQRMVHWRKNLFEVPKGRLGKDMIREMTHLLESWVSESDRREYCLKSLMILPNLLLQKTSRTKNAKHQNKVNRENLERRLSMWKDGKINELLLEGQIIQNRLPTSGQGKPKEEDLARSFRNLLSEGNVNGALRLLEGNKSGVLDLNDATRALLKEKHPDGKPLIEDLLLEGPIPAVHSVIFDEIDAELVKAMALKTNGAAGPSNLDASQWRRILCSKEFEIDGLDLCKAIADFAKSICTKKVEDLLSLEGYLACSLIPLDKNPGLRPIGIGEVLRRIVGKIITTVLKKDITDAVDGVQMCAGHQGGSEAAVHSMVDIFGDDSCQGLIQVDADNAFNSLNRKVLLKNIFHTCPEIAMYTYNCYATPARLFVIGGGEIKSDEGTTQGDPIAMPIYAIGLDPLITTLRSCLGVKQVAFADDLSGTGTIESLKLWWDKVVLLGPKIGYYAKPSKSWLIVKPQYLERANEIFHKSELKITSQGRRHLGAVIGSNEFKFEFVSEKVKDWVDELAKLTLIARVEPHVSYAAFTHGFKHKFNYVMRTIPDISDLLEPLDEAVDKFISTLFQSRDISRLERAIFSLPVRLGGLGIEIPSKISSVQYENSRLVTKQLVDQIMSQSQSNIVNDLELKSVKQKVVVNKVERQKALLDSLTEHLSPDQKKLLELTSEKGSSVWLTALPIASQGFLLSKQEFSDALAIRYGLNLKRLPSNCVCGQSFSVEHALTCTTGGYSIMRHNSIRDTIAGMIGEVVKDVSTEPILTPLSGEKFHRKATTTDPEARADVAARGFWSKGVKMFADIRVFNPLAPSYRSSTQKAIYKRLENEKKSKYAERIIEIEKGTFTPLVFSTLGGCGMEAQRFLKQLIELHANKKKCDHSKVANLIRTKLAFCILRATILCIRGARKVKRQEYEMMDIDVHTAQARLM